jgi:hypothetical protein
MTEKVFRFYIADHFCATGVTKSCIDDAKKQVDFEYQHAEEQQRHFIHDKLVSLLPKVRNINHSDMVLKNCEYGDDWRIQIV